MKTLVITVLAIVLPLHAALANNTNAAPKQNVAGQKIDSGLGELPHYSLWADPSGKNPMAKPKVVKAQTRSETNAPRDAGAKAAVSAATQVAGLK